MSEDGEFFNYTREEFVDEFVHPDDRAAVQEARDKRALKIRADYLTEMRRKAGLTQADVAELMGVTQQRVSAIENGAVAELATLVRVGELPTLFRLRRICADAAVPAIRQGKRRNSHRLPGRSTRWEARRRSHANTCSGPRPARPPEPARPQGRAACRRRAQP
jgi:transcriptional regulator with XRE-family HTH domain